MGRATQRQSRSRIELSPLEWAILTAANEDWMGLWELVIEARSLIDEIGDEEARDRARDALRSLTSRGLVYVCWFRSASNEEEKLTDAVALDLVAGNDVWDSPDWGSRYLAVAATKRGEAAWRKGSATPAA